MTRRERETDRQNYRQIDAHRHTSRERDRGSPTGVVPMSRLSLFLRVFLDGTPAERRLSSERNNGGKNGGEERKRKTKAKTIGLDDVGGIRQTQGRSSKPGEVEPSDVWTCQRAENLKKKKKKLQEAHSKENGDFLLC